MTVVIPKSFSARKHGHDEIAVLAVVQAFSLHGYKAGHFGTEFDSKECRDMLYDTCDPVSLTIRYRPDILVGGRNDGKPPFMVEAKHDSGVHENFSFEALAYFLDKHWSVIMGGHRVVAFAGVDVGKNGATVKICWLEDIFDYEPMHVRYTGRLGTESALNALRMMGYNNAGSAEGHGNAPMSGGATSEARPCFGERLECPSRFVSPTKAVRVVQHD